MNEVVVNALAVIGGLATVGLSLFLVFNVMDFFDKIADNKQELELVNRYIKAIFRQFRDCVTKKDFEHEIDIMAKCNNTNRDTQKENKEKINELILGYRQMSINVREGALKFLELVECVEETVKNQEELEKRTEYLEKANEELTDRINKLTAIKK